jgi:hypothetical protein
VSIGPEKRTIRTLAGSFDGLRALRSRASQTSCGDAVDAQRRKQADDTAARRCRHHGDGLHLVRFGSGQAVESGADLFDRPRCDKPLKIGEGNPERPQFLGPEEDPDAGLSEAGCREGDDAHG